MVDIPFIKQKIKKTFRHLEELEKMSFSTDSLHSDVHVYARVFYLYQNIIERCLGIAVYLLKVKYFPIGDTARDSFAELAN
jgi:uncharacterized protein YutE (UPF0331/DUF86 family)